MTGGGGDDRRKYARLDLKSRVEARLLARDLLSAVSDIFPAAGKNIGIEGICLASAKKLKQGDMLELQISLPGRKSAFNIKGEVRWCLFSGIDERGQDLYESGVKFLTIEKEHVRLMVGYLCGKLCEGPEGLS